YPEKKQIQAAVAGPHIGPTTLGSYPGQKNEPWLSACSNHHRPTYTILAVRYHCPHIFEPDPTDLREHRAYRYRRIRYAGNPGLSPPLVIALLQHNGQCP